MIGPDENRLVPEQAARPYGIIYLARNTANGKGYVGQTVKGLKARMREHQKDAKRGSKVPFHRAIRKYGFESFTWQVLRTCDSREDLAAAEQACITTMNTKVPNGYNLTDGGGGISGHVMSAESKQKMSEAAMGNTWGKGNTNCKGHTNHKGRVHSAETRQKMSEGLKRRWRL